MKEYFFIYGELERLGVEFETLFRRETGAYTETGKISLEKVQIKDLGTVVMWFDELDDCVK